MTAQFLDDIQLPEFGVVGTVHLALPTEHPAIAPCENIHGHVYDSTACWSGLSARWRLEGECLYLIELFGLKRLASPTPLVADWITGTCFINFGKHIAWIVEDLLTERCMAVEVERGRVLRSAFWCDDKTDELHSFYSRRRFQLMFDGKPLPTTDDVLAWSEFERVQAAPNDPFIALGTGDAPWSS